MTRIRASRRHAPRVAATFFILLLLTQAVLALGSDHPKEDVSSDHWPKGLSELVNAPERIHGYFVNAEDVFFFVGDQKQFDQALIKYAKLPGIVQPKIVIHEGTGRARSPWQEDKGRNCDWMIYSCPAAWKERDPEAKGYIVEIHIWKEGGIKIAEGSLPKGILVESAEPPPKAPESP